MYERHEWYDIGKPMTRFLPRRYREIRAIRAKNTVTNYKDYTFMTDTIEDLQVRFAVIAIEAVAKKMGISPSEVAQRLDKYNLIEDRLFKYYDTLHTQSQSYVADDILETLNNYEKDDR